MGVLPALPRACSECPWRLANQGRPHPHGFYSKGNLARLWAGLRSGDAVSMTCHPTDPRMVDFEGYEATGDREETHECTGALILVQREYMRFQTIALALEEGRTDGLRLYRKAHPKGLRQAALANLVARAAFGGTPFGGLRLARPNLADLEIGYEPLGAPSREELAAWALGPDAVAMQ